MGTRCDFYLGRDSMEWIGSIASDGHPDETRLRRLVRAETKQDYLRAIAALSKDGDFTSPEQGWPWPWKTSATSDNAIAYDRGVWVAYKTGYGSIWLKPEVWLAVASAPDVEYPDMSDKQSVALGPRSGLIVF